MFLPFPGCRGGANPLPASVALSRRCTPRCQCKAQGHISAFMKEASRTDCKASRKEEITNQCRKEHR